MKDSKAKQEMRSRFAKNPFYMGKILFPSALLEKYGNPWYARYMFWCFKEYQKTIVKLPRLHAKSTYVTFLYVMWITLTRQKKFILIVSSTGKQAVKFLARIKHYLKSRKVKTYYGILDAALEGIKEDGEISGYIEIEGKKKTPVWNFQELYIEAWGIRIMATSIKTANRGLLSIDDRPDLIILDDVEDKKNTNTLLLRDALLDTIYEELVPAGTRDCQFVMVGTICHYGSYLLKVEKSSVYHPIPIDRATMKIRDFEEINKKMPEEFHYYPKKEYFTQDITGLDGKQYKKGDETPEVATWQPHYSYEYFCLKFQEYSDVGKPLSFWQEFYNTPKDKSSRLFTEFRYLKDLTTARFRKDLVFVSTGDHLFPNGKKMINVHAHLGGDLAISDSENADNRAFVTVLTDPFKNVYVLPPEINKEPNPVILGEYVLRLNNELDLKNATFDGQHFQKWFGDVINHLRRTTIGNGKRIYKKLKVYQQSRSEKKEDVISATVSKVYKNLYFVGDEKDFALLENELIKLGYYDSDDVADGLTFACSNLTYPDLVEYDSSATPAILKNPYEQHDEIDELSDREAWFYA